MSAPKHTPPPWKILAEGHIVRLPNKIMFAANDMYCLEAITNEERVANACLISAAPLLLLALEQLVEAIHGPMPQLMARVYSAKAMILRARGEA